VLLPALLALAVLLAGGIALDRQSANLAEERMRAQVLSEVALIRAKLEGNINANIQLVRGLVSAVATEPDMGQARFQELASRLFAEQTQLRSIAAAPGLVISMTYPLEGNERAIGLDYRTNEAQRDAVLRARDSGKLVLAGPVELVQGGTGFVGRFPVFLDAQRGSHFWGVISAVVDAARLYAESGLLNRSLPLDIAITGKDAQGSVGARFFGPDLESADPIRAEVVLPSGSWEIMAVPKGGWTAGYDPVPMRLAMAAAAALILLPILIAGKLFEERQQNIRTLQTREAELARVSRRLSMALQSSEVGVWELDLQTGEETWDERTDELYGCKDDGQRRTVKDWEAAVHPDDLERAAQEFARMIETGRYKSDYRVRLKDGTIRHIRSIASRYQQPDGSTYAVGVNWDVTRDVELNEKLIRAHAIAEARNRELEEARVRIEHTALHDSLTSLPNRRYLDNMLAGDGETQLPMRGSIALLHIDLDRFKQINDTLGHAAGDAMLVHASRILQANTRDSDFVARIGGDEFVVLCLGVEGEHYLRQLAERIIAQMCLPVSYQGQQCRFGVSIGIAVERYPALDTKRLLVNADIALYRAKKRGRSRFEFFSEALQAEVTSTKRVADEILTGLERNEFVAYYQPQFDACTLDVIGVEALARWRHPTEGIKTPDSFLAIAEELNVVATIDRLILDQALTDLERWDSLGLVVPRASVNVSLRRLHEEDLISGLRKRSIAPGRISFELVESIYLDENDDMVAWNIEQLKDLGIQVEIDDFGTGYASIVSLQKLRPARLKIDRQLVHPILSDPAQRRLLSSIVDIGKSMDIEIVAEGVETLEHARILRELGVNILQGYAFSKPLSPEALEAFLAQGAWRTAS
jgi:diguanylate cyclase (GGDEF)-like protein